MTKFAIGALALTSACSLAYGGGSETKEWSTLDRDILSLTSNAAPAPVAELSGFVRARGSHSNDVDVNGNGSELSGFTMDNVRVALDIAQGDYGAHIALEAVDSNIVTTPTPPALDVLLLDAYATAKIAGGWMGQIGRFRAPFLASALVDENNMLLLDRTFNGQVWDDRSEGIQVGALYDQFGVLIALQNGSDALANGYMWTGRVTFSPMGTVGNQEGSYGASAETALRLGAAYSDDTDDSTGHEQRGEVWALDGSLIQGGFSLHAEIVDYQDDVEPDSGLDLTTGLLKNAPHSGLPANTHGSETPWSATAGFLVQQNVEIAARFEDLDDSFDTTAITVGVNYYAAGHNAKFTIQGTRSDSDSAAKEADTVAIGVTVGA